MNKISYLLLICIMISSCTFSQQNKKNQVKRTNISKTNNFQDSLSFALCEMYGLDQGIRKNEIYKNMDDWLARKIDSINFVKLMTFIKEFGYPNSELLGIKNIKQDCVGGVASILLHNPERLQNKKYLNILLKEADKGNLPRKFIATLLDKYYWAKSGGKKVLYGSQFGMPCKDQKEETNRARREIGMQPLADSLFIDCLGI